jgi:integrase
LAALLFLIGRLTIVYQRQMVERFKAEGRDTKAAEETLGKIWDHADIVSRYLWPVMIAAGVTVTVRDGEGKSVTEAKYTGLHSLRHFYASWLINRKKDGGLELPPKTVQARMGHSSIVVTMDTYGHLFPSSDDGSELAEAEKLLLA